VRRTTETTPPVNQVRSFQSTSTGWSGRPASTHWNGGESACMNVKAIGSSTSAASTTSTAY
jgi:hypothetical protein